MPPLSLSLSQTALLEGQLALTALTTSSQACPASQVPFPPLCMPTSQTASLEGQLASNLAEGLSSTSLPLAPSAPPTHPSHNCISYSTPACQRCRLPRWRGTGLNLAEGLSSTFLPFFRTIHCPSSLNPPAPSACHHHRLPRWRGSWPRPRTKWLSWRPTRRETTAWESWWEPPPSRCRR